MKSKTAPVLLHIFNRPKMVAEVMHQIRLAKPGKLYISSDAPRLSRPEEHDLCMESRKIVQQVDWDCEVLTFFPNENLGTKHALINAISWFFKHEPEGIILEEDCIPNQSFFRFCSHLLEYYRNDPRIMHIAGTNQQFGKKFGPASYYFSRVSPVWGWASWRRVWDKYDPDMKTYPAFVKQGMMYNLIPDQLIAKNLTDIFMDTHLGKNKTWDHQLGYMIAINNGLCILPNVNLISNIGVNKVGPNNLEPIVGNIPTVEMEDEIIHPDFFIVSTDADRNHLSWSYEDTDITQKQMYRKNQMDLFERLKTGIKRRLKM